MFAEDPVRWGVLGTAMIAVTRTIPAMRDAPTAEVVAIASRGGDRAERAAASLGIPRWHSSYEALLADPSVEAVYIPLPNQLHVDWSVRALDAGKHVLCEKPLALSVAEVRRLQHARDRNGRHIEEAFAFRNHPQWERIREIVDSKALGSVCALQATMAKQFLDAEDIRNNPAAGGGALYDMGAYVTAAFGSVMRRPPDRVLATLDIDPVFGIDRLSTALFDYGDAHASFSVATQAGTAAWGTHQSLSVLGSAGWLRCDFPFAHARPTACHIYLGDTTTVGGFPSSTISFEPVNQYARQIERFSRHLRGEPVPTWPIEDAMRTLTILEKLFESAHTGQWETVPPAEHECSDGGNR